MHPTSLVVRLLLSLSCATLAAPAVCEDTGVGLPPALVPGQAPPLPRPGPLAEPRLSNQVGFPKALTEYVISPTTLRPATVALGQKLFFEPRLSGDGTVACATCHDPARAFTDGRPVSVGIHGRVGQRRSSSARRIGRPRTLSRTKLRRTVPSFTVEVRRRPRLAATSRADVRSLETKPPPVAFDRESHPAEAAAIGAKKTDQSPVDASNSKGPSPSEPGCRRAAKSSASKRLIISDSVEANFKGAKAAIGAASKGQELIHSSREGVRSPCLPRARRWRTNCPPDPVNQTAHAQMKG